MGNVPRKCFELENTLTLGHMDAPALIGEIQKCLQEVPALRNERQGIGSSKVKAWKTEVEQLLRSGGKNTSKLLQNFQNLKFGAGPMGTDEIGASEVRFQTYQAEIDAAEKLLKNAVQTIQIFGITDGPKLPDWIKKEAKASGVIKLGAKEVDIATLTVHEFLLAILQLTESDRSLDESLKQEVAEHLNALKAHPLLSPFLNQTIDKVFSKLS
jgi:hypothetical protein